MHSRPTRVSMLQKKLVSYEPVFILRKINAQIILKLHHLSEILFCITLQKPDV
jgi:hypothetical protein